MKRLFATILAVVMLACSLSATAIENPMKEIFDDDLFEDSLGIDFDSDKMYSSKYSMYIINDEIGQVSFQTEDTEGKPVEWTLRFTRNPELDGKIEEFAGMYATDWVSAEPFEYTYTEKGDKDKDDTVTVTINSVFSESTNTSVYFWNNAGVSYSLSVVGDYSQMLMAEIFDGIMEACFD